MQFSAAEKKDGIRMSWNIWPKTRSDASKLIVPIGCLYSPLKPVTSLVKVRNNPVFCKGKNCGAVLNAFCQSIFTNKNWICPFCLTRNHFPISYNAISPENIPPEMQTEYSTVEYTIKSRPFLPVFIFVVDTCLSATELDSLKDSLLQLFAVLPENALVGLITFGKNAKVYELTFQECPKSFAFNGNSPTWVDRNSVPRLLGALPREEKSVAKKFLVPVSEGEFFISSIIEDLAVDPWPPEAKNRSARCTGKALELAVGLLETGKNQYHGRVVLFTGGPVSEGPGKVIGPECSETIRSHRDILKGSAPYFDEAQTFYNDLSKRCCEQSITVDIFACSLDQVGLAEMKVLVEKTGGNVVICESFSEETFRETFRKAFSSSSKEMTFCAEMEVITSREFKIAGAIGPMSPFKKEAKNVSSSLEIGLSGTNHWGLGSISPNTTVAIYFDISNMDAKAIPKNRFSYIQFITKFKKSIGDTILRVATLAIEFADMDKVQGMNYIRAGFDQEAACVLMARWAVFKTENEFASDIFRWIDNSLIKLIEKFASFQKKQPTTFRMSKEFSFYPQFMFYLRRSPFLSVFNSSPDETAYYRIVLLRENVLNSITMIQPAIFSYNLDSTVTPVLLDIRSCKPDRILILDSFFHVVLWHGKNIAEWDKQKIQEKEDYKYFGEILEKASNDAKNLGKDRIPHPILIRAVENRSEARHLVSKLNPSVSYKNTHDGDNHAAVFTDDVSLDVFMAHLRNVVVSKD